MEVSSLTLKINRKVTAKKKLVEIENMIVNIILSLVRRISVFVMISEFITNL